MTNKINLDKLTTEKRNIKTTNIHKFSSYEIVKVLNDEDKTVPFAVEKILDSIALSIDKIVEKINNNGRVFYIGAGTSGRLGILDASELPPTYNADENLFISIMAGGQKAIKSANEASEDSLIQSIQDLKENNFSSKDVLIGIAASGRTPYVVSAIEYANSLNAITISLSTTKNSKIGEISNIKLEAITGPEPITGSTRMKSGTAQKLILNMISTGVMIKLGKVYQNLMIDVKPLNKKLVERSIQIVELVTKKNREEIKNILIETKYSPLLSIVMIEKKLSLSDAKKLLEKNNFNINKIIN